MVLKAFLQQLSKKSRVLILGHAGMDVDALGSAIALSVSLPVSCVIGYPDHVNANARQMADKLHVVLQKDPAISDFDALILVDFNSVSHAGRLEGALSHFDKPVLILDHHEGHWRRQKDVFSRIEPDASAASVLVFDELYKNKFKLSATAHAALAAGILSDTAFLRHADRLAIRIFSLCLDSARMEIDDVAALFHLHEPLSARIAKLRSAHRMRVIEAGEFLIALSHVNYFESESAASLIGMGADVAFVAGVEHDTDVLRLNGRARREFVAATGVSLARIVSELPDFFGGHGNGHMGAAGFNVPHAASEEVLQKTLELLLAQLKLKFPQLALKEVM